MSPIHPVKEAGQLCSKLQEDEDAVIPIKVECLGKGKEHFILEESDKWAMKEEEHLEMQIGKSEHERLPSSSHAPLSRPQSPRSTRASVRPGLRDLRTLVTLPQHSDRPDDCCDHRTLA